MNFRKGLLLTIKKLFYFTSFIEYEINGAKAILCVGEGGHPYLKKKLYTIEKN